MARGKVTDGLDGLGRLGSNTVVRNWRLIGLGSVPNPRCRDRFDEVIAGSEETAASLGGRWRKLRAVNGIHDSSKIEGGSRVLDDE